MRVVATAGHVDHGKSTLVKALTGVNPDRWDEERRRGLTIDLGFAAAELPGGETFAFVDVPGHVRFIANMLAGVGAVDACCFVVDANEGWKPQSEEHLRILELLGIKHGLVALTKADLLDEELLEIAQLEVADRLAGTFLAEAEVVAVDSLSLRGIPELQGALARLLERTPAAADEDRPRLWVDRSFVIQGSGTVVTGTLTGGSLKREDEILLCPEQKKVRVRALQSQGTARDRIPPGYRTALNLTGVARHQVRRGCALVRAGQWHMTGLIDAALQTMGSVTHPISHRGAYFAYLGSGEFPAKIRILGARELQPGSEGLVRIYLPHRLPLRPGDRYVLRESGRGETVGGGEVLDVDPRLPASRAKPDRRPERVVAERGWVSADDLTLLTGVRLPPDVGEWVVSPQALSRAKTELLARIEGAGALGLDVATLSGRERALLDELDDLTTGGGRVKRIGGEDPFESHPYLDALKAQLFTPPPPDGVDPQELREMQRQGLIWMRDGKFFATAALKKATAAIGELLADHPEGFTVAEFRDFLGTTRKYALPLLAELDEKGVTRRNGDLRIAGPRMETLQA